MKLELHHFFGDMVIKNMVLSHPVDNQKDSTKHEHPKLFWNVSNPSMYLHSFILSGPKETYGMKVKVVH